MDNPQQSRFATKNPHLSEATRCLSEEASEGSLVACLQFSSLKMQSTMY